MAEGESSIPMEGLAPLLLLLLLSELGLIATQETQKAPWRLHTLFSVECQNYFDWQTVGLVHSFKKARQPGSITRLLSCTDEEKRNYKGMNLAPTFDVPSMSRHPQTGDWYPAINKPVGILHWVKYSKEAENTDWVVILDADMIIRGPIIPWELGAEKGRPIAAYYGYLIGCDNILAHLHTQHPELCDKVGGLLVMHIEDLRALAPLWLLKTEEVRNDRTHWGTNITGDIYGGGWISEMYGYSFGAAEVGLQHKINNDLMIYPGYNPRDGFEPILLHYGLPFSVGNWTFSKLDHHKDGIVYICNQFFPTPPYPREIEAMEADTFKRRALFLSIECINTLNEGLLFHHSSSGCPKPQWSRYRSFLRSKRFMELTAPKYLDRGSLEFHNPRLPEAVRASKIHTIFFAECTPYFDWQTIGFMHSFQLSGQPGNVTRLLSCTEENLKSYNGHDLAPTHYVPSKHLHSVKGGRPSMLDKSTSVMHWLDLANIDAEFVIILDTDIILRSPILPLEFGVARGYPILVPPNYFTGCRNGPEKNAVDNSEGCEKLASIMVMHIDDLRQFALYWLNKAGKVLSSKVHNTSETSRYIANDWIAKMLDYSADASKLQQSHAINLNMFYPGYIPSPGSAIKAIYYGKKFAVGNWSFDKNNWIDVDLASTCWAKFPDPPDADVLLSVGQSISQHDQMFIECMKILNEALYLHHKKSNCPDLNDNDNNLQRNKILHKEIKFSENLSRVKESNQPLDRLHLSVMQQKEMVVTDLDPYILGLRVLLVVIIVAVILFIPLAFGREVKRQKYKNRKTSFLNRCKRMWCL